MSRLLTALLLDDVKKEWNEALHPRGEGGRFAGAGFTAAGADPKALAAAAGRAARMGLGGSKELAAEAKQRARAAGAPKGEDVRAGGLARAAVRRELGAYAKRPEDFKPREVKGKGVENPKPPVGPPAKGGEQLEHHLTTSSVSTESLKKGSNVNETRFVTFADGSKGVFKPNTAYSPYGKGEDMTTMRYNIKPGMSGVREVATYDVAKIVGMQDMVPATVQRTFEPGSGPQTIAGRTGSLMAFVENAQPAAEYNRQRNDIIIAKDPYDGKEDFARAAMFDYIVGNEDRHPGNWMVSQKPEGGSKITLIDHGLTFPETGNRIELESIRGFMAKAGKSGMDTVGGYPFGKIPDMDKPPYQYAQVFRDNKLQIINALKQRGIPERAIQGVAARIDHTVNWTSHRDWKYMNPPGGW